MVQSGAHENGTPTIGRQRNTTAGEGPFSGLSLGFRGAALRGSFPRRFRRAPHERGMRPLNHCSSQLLS